MSIISVDKGERCLYELNTTFIVDFKPPHTISDLSSMAAQCYIMKYVSDKLGLEMVATNLDKNQPRIVLMFKED